eukprot:7298266-Prorocentrum_lima.AAC.1
MPRRLTHKADLEVHLHGLSSLTISGLHGGERKDIGNLSVLSSLLFTATRTLVATGSAIAQ